MIDYFDLEDEVDILDEEDVFNVVPVSKYIPDYELEVKNYMANVVPFPKNTIKYESLKIPAFDSREKEREWQIEEIRRCKEGWNGLTGKMYFYFNFCKIVSLKGRQPPQFRVCDAEWFKLIDLCQRSRQYGIICVKRRRVGASWKEAADCLHDVSFKTDFHIGMNSKTERDSQLLFSKVKYLYDALPNFLRVRTLSNTSSFLEFAYWHPSSVPKKKVGNRSDIIAVAPTDSAFEGHLLNKWICDEAGKIPNLEQLYSYTEECLMQETIRDGCPIIFGTSGDVGKEGKGLRLMWKFSHIYKLKKFFFAGWAGLYVDEYGNDNVEDCVRWIIYKRHEKAELGNKAWSDFVQKYPLNPKEAFNQASTGGIGDSNRINAQKNSLMVDPPKRVFGRFAFDAEEKVKWIPDHNGKCIIYEHPQANKKGLYVAGADPADHDDAYDEASDLALYILSRPDGLQPPKIMLEYVDRPKNVDEFYEQARLALMYYNDCKVLIEKNMAGMIKYFDRAGNKHMLAITPVSVTRMFGGKINTIGLRMTEQVKPYLAELCALFVKDYCEMIPSEELLDDFLAYGSRNTDRAMAFGIALIFLNDNVKAKVTDSTIGPARTPNWGFYKVGERIVRVTKQPQK